MKHTGHGFRVVRLSLALATVLLFAPPPGGRPGTARAAEKAGNVAIERIDLRFVGGEKVRVFAAGQEALAEVEITFKGTGRLGGAWEIAEPTTTAGSPQFRSLELVSRSLGMGRHEVLRSPRLPTTATGAYLVRLRVASPEIAGPLPVLRYFVGQPGGEAVAGVPATLVARGPVAGSLADGLKFSWQPVPGSIAYQIEIYDKDPGAAPPSADAEAAAACLIRVPSSLGSMPLTGIMVPGTQTEVALSQVAANRLAAGKVYLWRVVAIDWNGKVLCDSPLKELEL